MGRTRCCLAYPARPEARTLCECSDCRSRLRRARRGGDLRNGVGDQRRVAAHGGKLRADAGPNHCERGRCRRRAAIHDLGAIRRDSMWEAAAYSQNIFKVMLDPLTWLLAAIAVF